jgi:hypothetical protein
MSKITTIITLKLKTNVMKRMTRKITNEIISSIKNITLLRAYPKSVMTYLTLQLAMRITVIDTRFYIPLQFVQNAIIDFSDKF